ncbi:hypothetical protein JHK84_044864 [Glycine max]|uniref:Auxin-induced in root cultures protein 12 n=1 Tax=Glycine soja TaxID=3848 RepID=A0A445GFY0_GLYSO|nr:auxin-induced in root cultures protein 12-like [Glycine soja]KAG4938613.1 hypothetical protein JHK86_044754 [Glycine max]KAG4951501.1 hypothetical protein JHK85_045368 [Glycine max]KAG5107957.1 hypothetical protein JHK84_044864 [Glycine max]KAH1150525.1 hypothetical protein GYH30_044505 [Glycine max]RZB60150.1 Auxin-induced in root cultures protein 12 [Glycine soja]
MALHDLPFTPMTTISLFIILFSLFSTPSHSALTCASQKLNRTYANCTNLPTLGATLHFTFNATNRTLSVAFSASPPSPSGWVAWGLNLAGGGMPGAEALLALPSTSGSAVTLRRYNLTSYKSIDVVKAFTFESWDLSAEETNGAITIYGTVKIPDSAENVSHVWQVGPVAAGVPAVHGFKDDNIHAKAALPVALAGSSGSSAASGENATTPASGDKKNGAAAAERLGLGFHFWLVFALMVGVVAL